MTLNKVVGRIYRKLVAIFFQRIRVLFYSTLSNYKIEALKKQPVLATGIGKIEIGKNVCFGVIESQGYYSGYSYLNARREHSYIEIGDNCNINNSISIISDGKKIIIGKNCLIGSDLEIIDSNFHDIDPEKRFSGGCAEKGDVIVGNNVFIGNSVRIVKNTVIGDNCVVGVGSVVSGIYPENVILAGVPAKIIKHI